MEQSAKAVVKTPFLTYLKDALKGTLISMVFTTAAILLLALIVQETKLSQGVAEVFNQILKIGGILVASYFATKSFPGKRWLCGGLTGILYMAINYLLISLITGMWGSVPLMFSDLLMGLLIGMVFAIIVASFRGAKTGPTRPKSRSRRSPFQRMQRTRSVKKVANID
jgi:putative membrane protein (TIGR04086 family)